MPRLRRFCIDTIAEPIDNLPQKTLRRGWRKRRGLAKRSTPLVARQIGECGMAESGETEKGGHSQTFVF
jgi:hypothetical protein